MSDSFQVSNKEDIELTASHEKLWTRKYFSICLQLFQCAKKIHLLAETGNRVGCPHPRSSVDKNLNKARRKPSILQYFAWRSIHHIILTFSAQYCANSTQTMVCNGKQWVYIYLDSRTSWEWWSFAFQHIKAMGEKKRRNFLFTQPPHCCWLAVMRPKK